MSKFPAHRKGTDAFASLPALIGDNICSTLDNKRGLIFTERKYSTINEKKASFLSNVDLVNSAVVAPNTTRNARIKNTKSDHFTPINPVLYKDVKAKKPRGPGVFKEKHNLNFICENRSLSKQTLGLVDTQ